MVVPSQPTHSRLRGLQVPPLENGDRLNQLEFERRYNLMPHVKKAELVEGVFYMASPLRFELHAEPHGDLVIWLGNYKVATLGVRLGDNPSVTNRLKLSRASSLCTATSSDAIA